MVNDLSLPVTPWLLRNNYHVAEYPIVTHHIYGKSNTSQCLMFIDDWCSLLDDASNIGGSPKPPQAIRRWINNLLSGKLLDVIQTYAKLAHTLIENLVWTELGSSLGPYLKGFEKTPIFREYLKLIETRNPIYLRYILSFLWFGKKLSYVNLELEATALRSWRDLEQRLGKLDLRSWEQPDLKPLIAALCGDLDSEELRPKHGGGSVANPGVGRSPFRKTKKLALDWKLRFFVRKFSSRAFRFLKEYVFDEVACDSPHAIGRFHLVENDYRKMRSICMEPASYMFFQQSLMRILYRNIRVSTGGTVDLNDQEPNAELAKEASLTSELDTLDLSSASDSVHADLIWKYFPPDWKAALMSTRTSSVELPGGDVVDVHKFAPMGSAVCFPIQTIVFTSVVLAMYIKRLRSLGYTVHTPSTPQELSRFFYRYVQGKKKGDRVLGALRVYGDDIICDSNVTSDVVACLERLGFTINVNKSFIGQQSFRESCGGFYWCGEDVTPVLYRIKRSSSPGLSDASLGGAVDLANRARFLGYYSLAANTRLLLKENFYAWRYIPYVHPGTYFGYHCKVITDFGKPKYKKDWQRYEQKVIQLRGGDTQRVDTEDDVYSAFAYFSHARANHGSDVEFNQQRHHMARVRVSSKGEASYRAMFPWWEHETTLSVYWTKIPVDR